MTHQQILIYETKEKLYYLDVDTEIVSSHDKATGKQRQVKTRSSPCGYCYFSVNSDYNLNTNGDSKVYLHKTIGTQGNPHNKKIVVHHKDNNPKNNNPDNLQVLTHREHAFTHMRERKITINGKSFRLPHGICVVKKEPKVMIRMECYDKILHKRIRTSAIPITRITDAQYALPLLATLYDAHLLFLGEKPVNKWKMNREATKKWLINNQMERYFIDNTLEHSVKLEIWRNVVDYLYKTTGDVPLASLIEEVKQTETAYLNKLNNKE